MAPTLETQARQFAADQSDLLNQTITDGIRLSVVIRAWRTEAKVPIGYGVGKGAIVPKPIPVTLGRKPPGLFLGVGYLLTLDPEGEYLAVSQSFYSLLGSDARSMLAHWDYAREPMHKYPAAHFQVEGSAPGFDDATEHARSALGRTCPHRTLRDFHFPVGGRRFRPTLEDVIEFLVLEDLVDHRSGWQSAIDAGRARWEERQLRAAIRRNPDVAKSAVADLDA